jgi:LytS/YehU family sensor histidine kinase
LVALGVVGIFFFLIKFITSQIRKREIEKTAINKRFAELEFQALQAQMNPHFVFNAMSTLQYYILKNESENASEYLAKFARLMRLFLDSSRNKFIELRKEIDLLRSYIELEQARLEHSFQYQIDIDPEVEVDTKIPSVMIQPFVENAILHGLRHKKEGGGLLKLQFSARDHIVECRIEDNGVGREESAMINKAKDKLYRSQALNIIDEKVKEQAPPLQSCLD